jgi:hypothetical protein
MDTDGAAIASLRSAAEAITVVAEPWPIVVTLHTAAGKFAAVAIIRLVAVQRLPMHRHLAQAAVADRTRHQHVAVVADMLAAVDMPAVAAVGMKAADTGKFS